MVLEDEEIPNKDLKDFQILRFSIQPILIPVVQPIIGSTATPMLVKQKMMSITKADISLGISGSIRLVPIQDPIRDRL